MAELGDEHIDLLKLDIEGGEYELMRTLDLRSLGAKIFATQVHHTGTVADARRLIEGLRKQGYELVGCRPAVKLTFALAELLEPAPEAQRAAARERISAWAAATRAIGTR